MFVFDLLDKWLLQQSALTLNPKTSFYGASIFSFSPSIFPCKPEWFSSSAPRPLRPLPRLTVAGADGEADALLFAVEDHVEALHDDCPHHGTSAGLGHGELVAVLLGGGHVLHRPQVLLREQQTEGQGSNTCWLVSLYLFSRTLNQMSTTKHFVKSRCTHEKVRKCRIWTNNENSKVSV